MLLERSRCVVHVVVLRVEPCPSFQQKLRAKRLEVRTMPQKMPLSVSVACTLRSASEGLVRCSSVCTIEMTVQDDGSIRDWTKSMFETGIPSTIAAKSTQSRVSSIPRGVNPSDRTWSSIAPQPQPMSSQIPPGSMNSRTRRTNSSRRRPDCSIS